jgi:mycothiol synthase
VGKLRSEDHDVVVRTSHLDAAEVVGVLALTHAAGDADGAYPLSEHVMLHLRHGGDRPATHLLAYSGHDLVGYAHVDRTDVVEGASAELCVHPLHRRRGLGRALVLAAMAASAETDPAGRLRLWAHGDHPSANALALSLGFVRSRVLWQMRRSLYAPVPPPVLPEGITLRAFRPGVDDEAWLALNNRAFAEHPDQGGWSLDDLRVRLAEAWFDPAGFLLAERADAELVGFHWTKVHGTLHGASAASPDVADSAESRDSRPDEHDHDPIGEVYVLGVDPSAHGHGLGAALTLAGLRYLRSRELDQVMLYVDETNTGAIALYQSLGFARWSTDVSFRRP